MNPNTIHSNHSTQFQFIQISGRKPGKNKNIRDIEKQTKADRDRDERAERIKT